MNWAEFFSMGGYAFYVWGSYIVAFVMLAGEVIFLIKKHKACSKLLTKSADL